MLHYLQLFLFLVLACIILGAGFPEASRNVRDPPLALGFPHIPAHWRVSLSTPWLLPPGVDPCSLLLMLAGQVVRGGGFSFVLVQSQR